MKRPVLVRRRKLLGLAFGVCLALLAPAPAVAQGVELASLDLRRDEGLLTVSFDARLTLPRAVEGALQHGVPLYFVAEATLYRNRWYWRDERLARVTRSWRVAFLPLTTTWRVSLGAFSQTHATLAEALAVVTRATRWRLAELAALDPESRHYVEFSYRLDSTQLPSPMQIGLGGQSDWQLGIERTLRLDPP